jgi:ATP-dependent Clp protease ATP-binding subunit ClpA
MKSETLEEITCRAEAFAQRSGNPMNSGHLLWAIITGSGVAANTLTLRNLKEGDVRKALRGLEFFEANPSAIDKVMQTSKDIARSVRSKAPGALHLLAAITTVRECIGFKIITEAGLNVDTIRLQSLKNMTSGLTREHGVSGNQLHLSTLTDVKNISGHGSRQRPQEITQVKPVSLLANARRKAVGQAIEQAQKKMLKTRNVPAPAVVLQEKKAQLASFNASDYPLLFSLGRNLSQEAVEQKYRSIVGRRAEIEQIADVLNKKRANCPCLVGLLVLVRLPLSRVLLLMY